MADSCPTPRLEIFAGMFGEGVMYEIDEATIVDAIPNAMKIGSTLA